MVNTSRDDGSSQLKPQKVKFKRQYDPMDIKVFQPSRQKRVPTPPPCLRENGGCSHLCLAATSKAGFSCACPTGEEQTDREAALPIISLIIRLTGLTLSADGKTCNEEFPSLLLLARKGGDLRFISLDTDDKSDVVINLDTDHMVNAVGIDYDPVEKFVFWTDQLGIHKAHINGSGFEDVITQEVSNDRHSATCKSQKKGIFNFKATFDAFP